MFKSLKKPITKLLLLKLLLFIPVTSAFYYLNRSNEVKAGLEFQWDDNSAYRRLKWLQTDSERRNRNTLYFFLRPSDRKNGLLKIDMKIPKRFENSLKTEKITLCKVHIGGFDSRTKCLENIPAELELNKDENNASLSIYPLTPIPSNKDSYAIVFKLFNPRRSGLYQFHSYGQSAGKIPVSSYIGSWTIVID
ncbi:MAG: hypothetical protein CMK49_00825 [Prochlorococcus sp. SP3034]|nr:hypothetical protein [Prochlorococcus sp. SP3034]|tara:strand:+ start:556 stop:1134 length:579 start_codon:yes stop_codon:yes gene_type:complete